MGLKTKKEALASIKKRVRTVSGEEYAMYDAYLGMNALTHKTERLFASSKSELTKRIDEFYEARAEAGDFSTYLAPEQIVDAKAALGMLRGAGMDISLSECARREIERFSAVMAHPTAIGDAYAEFLASKRDGGDKDKTVATTGKWVEKTGTEVIIGKITSKDLASYLNTNYGEMSPTTYNSHLSYIRTFLNWCVKHDPQYLGKNPCDELKTKEIEWKEPEYMKPDEVERLFRALESEKDQYPELLAFCISGFFCGVRRAESMRIAEMDDAAKVHLDDETIRIGKGKGFTRGRRPRAMHIEPNALAWMRSFDYIGALKTIRPATTHTLARFAERHGIRMFHNCARHTFITMHVAAYGDPAKTQAMVGTSGTMLCNNYRGLASRKEGEAYFAIYPSSSVTSPAAETAAEAESSE